MQGIDFGGILWTISVVAVPLILAITVHEMAHGWAAMKLGDFTAHSQGRVSLNPLRHVDPVGTIAVPLGLYLVTLGQVTFGWARPVPVNARNFANPRRDMMFVALAGPASNFLMAAIWSFLIYAQIYLLPVEGEAGRLLFEMRNAGIFINVLLGMLNLVPIPPLDGSRVLAAIVPARIAVLLDRMERYGILVLIALVAVLWYTGYLGPLVEAPLGAAVGFFHTLPGAFN
jgi:Zn-dependent protease